MTDFVMGRFETTQPGPLVGIKAVGIKTNKKKIVRKNGDSIAENGGTASKNGTSKKTLPKKNIKKNLVKNNNPARPWPVRVRGAVYVWVWPWFLGPLWLQGVTDETFHIISRLRLL